MPEVFLLTLFVKMDSDFEFFPLALGVKMDSDLIHSEGDTTDDPLVTIGTP